MQNSSVTQRMCVSDLRAAAHGEERSYHEQPEQGNVPPK